MRCWLVKCFPSSHQRFSIRFIEKVVEKFFQREFAVQLNYSLIIDFYSAQSFSNMKVNFIAIHRTSNSIEAMVDLWNYLISERFSLKLHQRIILLQNEKRKEKGEWKLLSRASLTIEINLIKHLSYVLAWR